MKNETPTYSLKVLKNEIILAHGNKKTAPSYAQHEATVNIERNYREFCKSDSDFNNLKQWAWSYYK